ncbi:hypothetical protein B5S29_g4397 [[Candida] boidinii]|nr:hypothetical protein B5S29_g4397 [[Candida] boidinii]
MAQINESHSDIDSIDTLDTLDTNEQTLLNIHRHHNNNNTNNNNTTDSIYKSEYPIIPTLHQRDSKNDKITQISINNNNNKIKIKNLNYLKFFKSFGLILIILLFGTGFLLQQLNNFYKTYLEIQNFNKLNYNNSFPIIENTDDNVDDNNKKIPLTFNSVRNGTFRPETHRIQWIKSPDSLTNDSGTYMLIDDNKYILKKLSDKNFEKLLFKGDIISYNNTNHEIQDFILSDDLKFALLITDKKHHWRHSTFSSYWILNIESSLIQPLFKNNDISNKICENISIAKFSPDSNKIAFVLENNIYLKDLNNINQMAIQITFDGGENLFYGKPDWVYEEEVFESDFALWWSPNSNFISILRSNDTLVPTFPIPYFVQNENENNYSSYPNLLNIKYPKSGYPNPIVDLIVYDLNKMEIVTLNYDSDPFYNDNDILIDERLITGVSWVGDSHFLIRTTNRESDIMKIFYVDAISMESEITRIEGDLNNSGNKDNNKRWFEITHNIVYIPSNGAEREFDGYLDVIDVNGFDHLGFFYPSNNSEPIILTQGEWEVIDGASGFDFINDKVYFISTEKSSIERHLYSVSLNGENLTNLTDTSIESWYDCSFSTGSRYLLLNYNGPQVPYQKLIDLREDKIEILNSNDKLLEAIENYDIPINNYGELKICDENLNENYTINYKETLPLNFNSNFKYPLLFFVYGGPGSQLVTKNFGISFSSIIASELNTVVVTVDGRGTGFKGKNFRNIVRDNLGHYEVIDQIYAANYWKNNKKYIDESKIAIWGWSYGGFMTLKTLETDMGKTFKYGMSVAPVTDWKFYDSVYTERYMHTPENNKENYEISSIHLIENFKNVKKFLLMHGTGDDNVHIQNSLTLLDKFNLHGLENYDLEIFPDSDHSISYHNANTIVYDKLFNWLSSAFNGEFDKDNDEYNKNYNSFNLNNYNNIDLYG